jgi:hypothetical protein
VVAAKKFPEQAFHPVALHRFPQALGHHQPQPRPVRCRGSQGHSEMARIKPLAQGLGPKEVTAAAETLCLGKPGGPSGIGVRTVAEHRRLTSWRGSRAPHHSDCEAFTALGPTAL